MRIDIRGLDKAAVLVALYNRARTQGMGMLHYRPEDMTIAEAQAILAEGHTYFDYLHGRVMKIRLEGEDFDPALYDRDNGSGAAQAAIDSIVREVAPETSTVE